MKLLAALQRLFTARTVEVRQAFHRVLPFGDLVVDRWEKARMLGFGEHASIYDSVLVLGDVYVGKHSWVGPQVVLDGAAAPVRVGDWCCLSAGVHVYTHNTVGWCVTGGRQAKPCAPVTIGSRVYVGPQAVITKGVTIGEGSVIGAFSYVNRDIPPGVIAWGQPARVIGRVIVDEATGTYHMEFDQQPHSEGHMPGGKHFQGDDA